MADRRSTCIRLFCVALATALVASCSTALVQDTAQARLNDRVTELRDLDLPNEEPAGRFLEDVLPGWLQIVGDHREAFQALPDTLGTEDVLALAYQIALRRTGQQPGVWSEAIQTEVTTIASVLCTIRDWLKLPKREDYQAQMAEIQLMAIPGAYGRLLRELAIRPSLLEISIDTLQSEPLPSPPELLDGRLLELAGRPPAER